MKTKIERKIIKELLLISKREIRVNKQTKMKEREYGLKEKNLTVQQCEAIKL